MCVVWLNIRRATRKISEFDMHMLWKSNAVAGMTMTDIYVTDQIDLFSYAMRGQWQWIIHRIYLWNNNSIWLGRFFAAKHSELNILNRCVVFISKSKATKPTIIRKWLADCTLAFVACTMWYCGTHVQTKKTVRSEESVPIVYAAAFDYNINTYKLEFVHKWM